MVRVAFWILATLMTFKPPLPLMVRVLLILPNV
jgi:hypothetical protein